MNVVTHFPLNINKRPLGHYGSASIWLRLLKDTLVLMGWAAMEFIWARNIFLISLFKGREILEGSSIFIENSISPLRVNWCVPKTWVLQMDVVGESGLKQVYFPLKYNTM